jgi:hypothetical protein
VPRPVPTQVPVLDQPLNAEIQWPHAGDQVTRSFRMLVLAPTADRVDVFLEPDRDRGGHLVGSTSTAQRRPGSSLEVPVTAPSDAHTLFVHVSSMSTGQEQVIEVPVRVQ